MVKFTQNSTEKQNPAMFPALSPSINTATLASNNEIDGRRRLFVSNCIEAH